MEQLTTKYVQSKVFTADVQQLANQIYSLCSRSCSSVLVGFFSSFLLFLFFLYLCFHVVFCSWSFPASFLMHDLLQFMISIVVTMLFFRFSNLNQHANVNFKCSHSLFILFFLFLLTKCCFTQPSKNCKTNKQKNPRKNDGVS